MMMMYSVYATCIGDDRILEGKSSTKCTRRERFAFLLYLGKNVVIDALYRVQYPWQTNSLTRSIYLFYALVKMYNRRYDDPHRRQCVIDILYSYK